MAPFLIAILWYFAAQYSAQYTSTIIFNIAICSLEPSSALFANRSALTPVRNPTETGRSSSPARLSSSNSLAYSVFHNPYNRKDDPGSFETDFIKNMPAFSTPERANFSWQTCGTTNWVNISTQLYIDGGYSSYGILLGHRNFIDMSAIAVLLQGYITMLTTGTYTFSGSFDNFGYIWLGKQAFNPWKTSATAQGRTIADATSDGRIIPGTSDVVKLDFKAGDVVPFTGLWANAGGPGLFQFTAIFPNGTVWIDDWLNYLLLPNPADPWVPKPRVRNQIKAAACPEIGAATGGVLCGLDEVQPVYYGKGMVADIAYSQQIIATNFYPEISTNCQAARSCQAATKHLGGCYFTLYHYASQPKWECVTYNSSDGSYPQFKSTDDGVVESLGYVIPCGKT